eukprot:UN02168
MCSDNNDIFLTDRADVLTSLCQSCNNVDCDSINIPAFFFVMFPNTDESLKDHISELKALIIDTFMAFQITMVEDDFVLSISQDETQELTYEILKGQYQELLNNDRFIEVYNNVILGNTDYTRIAGFSADKPVFLHKSNWHR